MPSPALPPALSSALESLAHGRSQNELAQRAQLISDAYRSGGNSRGIRTDDDALAYALARMPATYAAVAACLAALLQVRPEFAPQSLTDCGAGPGTASWAATQAFPALRDVAMIDANPALRALALDLARDVSIDVDYSLGDVVQTLATTRRADLVVASYVIGELSAVKLDALADALWHTTEDTLLVVEPGTPAGYKRILALRDRLIARGAFVLAPCPHDLACPLIAPDWCHFAQRLPRSRAHRRIKGADVPFEDEKFSYVALGRTAHPRPVARILAPPVVNKIAVNSKLCTAAGIVPDIAPRRDREAYAQARKRDWGDAITPDDRRIAR